MKYLIATACVLAVALASSADPADAKTQSGKNARAAAVTADSGPIERNHRKHGGRPGAGGVRVCKSSDRHCLNY
jgi:hypothetical protein